MALGGQKFLGAPPPLLFLWCPYSIDNAIVTGDFKSGRIVLILLGLAWRGTGQTGCGMAISILETVVSESRLPMDIAKEWLPLGCAKETLERLK